MHGAVLVDAEIDAQIAHHQAMVAAPQAILPRAGRQLLATDAERDVMAQVQAADEGIGHVGSPEQRQMTGDAALALPHHERTSRAWTGCASNWSAMHVSESTSADAHPRRPTTRSVSTMPVRTGPPLQSSTPGSAGDRGRTEPRPRARGTHVADSHRAGVQPHGHRARAPSPLHRDRPGPDPPPGGVAPRAQRLVAQYHERAPTPMPAAHHLRCQDIRPAPLPFRSPRPPGCQPTRPTTGRCPPP